MMSYVRARVSVCVCGFGLVGLLRSRCIEDVSGM